jgi:hypothetical protein
VARTFGAAVASSSRIIPDRVILVDRRSARWFDGGWQERSVGGAVGEAEIKFDDPKNSYYKKSQKNLDDLKIEQGLRKIKKKIITKQIIVKVGQKIALLG